MGRTKDLSHLNIQNPNKIWKFQNTISKNQKKADPENPKSEDFLISDDECRVPIIGKNRLVKYHAKIDKKS